MRNDIRTADLNLLKAFSALLDTRSVTKTGERLGLTQPAVSGMLNRLRETFDDPLFVRAQRGMLPTPRAEALAEPLRRALSEIEALLQPEAFDPATADRTISIAATDYAQQVVLLPFLSGLRENAPGIRIAIRPVATETLALDMEQGKTDFALVTPQMAPENLRARHLFDEHYVCVLRQDHRAAGQKMDLDTFCALDHALMSHDGTRFQGVTDLALAALDRTRRVIMTAPNFGLVLDLVRTSDTCALLPKRLVKGQKGLHLQEPPLPVPGFTKILVWHERTHHDPAMIWLRQQIAKSVRPAGNR